MRRVTSRRMRDPDFRGSTDAPVQVMTFASGDAYATGSAPGSTLGTARVRFRFNSVPGTSFKWVAGESNGSSNAGWLLCTEDPVGGAVAGRLVAYVSIDGTLTRIWSKYIMPSDVGRMMTVHLVCDGTKAHMYLDGKELFSPRSYTAQDQATYALCVGARNDPAFSGDVSISEVAVSGTALNASQVSTDYAYAVGTALSGETHRYGSSTSPGASWTDSAGALNMTRIGSPVLSTVSPSYLRHRGPVEVYGDSIAAGRQEDTTTGDGWRRAIQRNASTSSKSFTYIGASFSSNPTYDYDYYYSAVPGEALVTRLATLQADLAANGPSNTATILAYGINDIVAQNRTAAQLWADVVTAVGYINTARPGRPILVSDVLQVATGSGTAGQHAEVTSYNSAFAANIASLQATYSNLVGVFVSSTVTDPNDTAQLFDGTHPTAAVYSLMSAKFQAALLPVL